MNKPLGGNIGATAAIVATDGEEGEESADKASQPRGSSSDKKMCEGVESCSSESTTFFTRYVTYHKCCLDIVIALPIIEMSSPSSMPRRSKPRLSVVVAIVIAAAIAGGGGGGGGVAVVSSFRLLPATTTTARSSPAAAAARRWSAAATGGSGGVDAPTPPSIDGSMLAVGEDGSGGPTTTGTTSLLTPATIAELIEVSFVQSCLQLSKGYVDVLKLFVAAVKAGYDLSVPLDDLVRLVGDSPVRSAGRELVVEEVGLRDEWMGVVYGLLDALGGDVVVDGDGGGGGRKECGDADDDDDDDPSRAAAHGRISNAVRAALSVRIELRDEEARSGGESDSSVALSNLTVERALASISRAGGGGAAWWHPTMSSLARSSPTTCESRLWRYAYSRRRGYARAIPPVGGAPRRAEAAGGSGCPGRPSPEREDDFFSRGVGGGDGGGEGGGLG